MRPYTIGTCEETGAILVGDSRTHTLFLRGPASECKAICELVNAANDWINSEGDEQDEPKTNGGEA